MEEKNNKKRKLRIFVILGVLGVILLIIALGIYSLTGKTIEDNKNSSENENVNGVDNVEKDTTNLEPIALNCPLGYRLVNGKCIKNSGGGSSGSSYTEDDDFDLIDSEIYDKVYSYSDDYSGGGFFIDGSNKEIEVLRSYVWKSQFGAIFVGKIKVVSSSDNYDWYGSRLALVNPENILERYEIRLLPNEQRVEVRYVDRTNRSGTSSGYDPNTISEYLDSAPCDIEIGDWYYISVFRKGNKLKTQIIRFDQPTCFIEWEDDRITGEELAIGIQSAGKYVVSRFDKIFTI